MQLSGNLYWNGCSKCTFQLYLYYLNRSTGIQTLLRNGFIEVLCIDISSWSRFLYSSYIDLTWIEWFSYQYDYKTFYLCEIYDPSECMWEESSEYVHFTKWWNVISTNGPLNSIFVKYRCYPMRKKARIMSQIYTSLYRENYFSEVVEAA